MSSMMFCKYALLLRVQILGYCLGGVFLVGCSQQPSHNFFTEDHQMPVEAPDLPKGLTLGPVGRQERTLMSGSGDGTALARWELVVKNPKALDKLSDRYVKSGAVWRPVDDWKFRYALRTALQQSRLSHESKSELEELLGKSSVLIRLEELLVAPDQPTIIYVKCTLFDPSSNSIVYLFHKN